jgi:AcrR family transcriptional regulator
MIQEIGGRIVEEELLSPARERIREARRLALVEAAEQVFAERGFAGATVADIAKRAGYSAGNLYNVFDGKEALFRAVVASRTSLLLERLEEAVARQSQLTAKIEAFTWALIRFAQEHRRFFSIYVQATSGLPWRVGGLVQEAVEMQQVLRSRIVRLLRGAIEKGEIVREDPELYACLVLGTLRDYVSSWIQQGGSAQELETVAKSLSQMLSRAMGVA